MNASQLTAQLYKSVKLLAVFGVGNTRKIDLQKFLVLFTVRRRMEHSVDVVEEFFRSSRPNDLLNLRYNFQIEIWGASTIVGVEVEGEDMFE
jgi:hypothetical protein